jgi:hypothetical protein
MALCFSIPLAMYENTYDHSNSATEYIAKLSSFAYLIDEIQYHGGNFILNFSYYE